MKKIIGTTSAINGSKNHINKAYIEAFTTESTIPVIIPVFNFIEQEIPSEESLAKLEEVADEISERIDALVLTGGTDINPVNYNDYNSSSFNCQNAKDYLDRVLINSFIQKNKPILGICRGFQVLGLMMGLKYFVQDLIEVKEFHTATDKEFEFRDEPAHSIYVWGKYKQWLIENRLIKDGECPQINVNSWHHQGFVLLRSLQKIKEEKLERYLEKITEGTDLEIIASTRAVIEGFAHKTKPVLAVQWHPEEYVKSLVIKFFLEQYLSS